MPRSPEEERKASEIASVPATEEGGQQSMRDAALDGLPSAWREKLIEHAAAAGVRHENDVGWLLVGSVINAWASAAAAGQAAKEVQEGLARIPDQISDGATRASDTVLASLLDGSKQWVTAFTVAVNSRQAKLLEAADAGADKIREAAETLTQSLDAAIDAKKAEGVSDFAKAAADAGRVAATASLVAQVSRSAAVSVVAFLIACAIGAVAMWGYLDVGHKAMPEDMTVFVMPDGQSVVKIKGGSLGPDTKCGPDDFCITVPAQGK
ncbi:hypothetical protein [Acidithiobacillus sp.]|jgi:hypothetical protein|uniref:hypothetical protein n=1 Tax=Acidithiobacillus sp. TaxID=1872118 RepID=UPI003561DC16